MSERAAMAWGDDRVSNVLDFWFDEVGPKGWFGGGAALDSAIVERFSGLHGVVRTIVDEALLRDANSALAAIIVLDQFSRQMFRGQAEAFASDATALGLADAAVSRGYDLDVLAERRVFFYLPFEHAEDMPMQDRAVALISRLGDETFTKYAIAHREVIARFGRFPHRNAALGRVSTEAERTYLAQPGSGF